MVGIERRNWDCNPESSWERLGLLRKIDACKVVRQINPHGILSITIGCFQVYWKRLPKMQQQANISPETRKRTRSGPKWSQPMFIYLAPSFDGYSLISRWTMIQIGNDVRNVSAIEVIPIRIQRKQRAVCHGRQLIEVSSQSVCIMCAGSFRGRLHSKHSEWDVIQKSTASIVSPLATPKFGNRTSPTCLFQNESNLTLSSIPHRQASIQLQKYWNKFREIGNWTETLNANQNVRIWTKNAITETTHLSGRVETYSKWSWINSKVRFLNLDIRIGIGFLNLEKSLCKWVASEQTESADQPLQIECYASTRRGRTKLARGTSPLSGDITVNFGSRLHSWGEWLTFLQNTAAAIWGRTVQKKHCDCFLVSPRFSRLPIVVTLLPWVSQIRNWTMRQNWAGSKRRNRTANRKWLKAVDVASKRNGSVSVSVFAPKRENWVS